MKAPANDNTPQTAARPAGYDIDAGARIWSLGPDGQRLRVVERFSSFTNAARRLAVLNGSV